MAKLNISVQDSDGDFHKREVTGTIIKWHPLIKTFHHKFEGKYYLTDYTSGSIIVFATTLHNLRSKFDIAVKKY